MARKSAKPSGPEGTPQTSPADADPLSRPAPPKAKATPKVKAKAKPRAKAKAAGDAPFDTGPDARKAVKASKPRARTGGDAEQTESNQKILKSVHAPTCACTSYAC